MEERTPEKRILIAFALSFLVLGAWSLYMRTKYPRPERPPQEAPVSTAPAAVRPAPPEVKAKAVPAPPAAGVKQGSEERTITVETDTATIVFSTRGAVAQSWQLKKYHDDSGRPLDLVQGAHTGLGYPFALELADPKQEEALNRALFVASTPAAELKAPAELVFEWSDGRLAGRKRFRFGPGYLCEIETSVVESSRPLEHRLAWRGGFGEHANAGSAARGTEGQVFVRTGKKLLKQPARVAGQTTSWLLWKTASPFPYSGEASYAGLEDRYFAAVFLPRQPQFSVTARTRPWTPPGEEKAHPIGEVAVGVPPGTPVGLYVGPKANADLETVQPVALADGSAPQLADELVDFGWFWWVAQPLFLGMQWMHAHLLSNYGWVIVLLTIAINVLLFPLKWKSMESAWKMQKIAPQLKAIQARYKQYKFNDPRKQEMQAETMALYKQHGVNPMGGCLPLLVQLPFFYGFYKVLAIAIELRQAPWVLWIHDLSLKDPYYVLPIVMTVTMFVSTKMTPVTTTDPAQQKMMQFFPLMFGFFFMNVSAGLVLYWLMSSVVGIAQQWWINKRQRTHELVEKQAAKERKKKRKGQSEEGPA